MNKVATEAMSGTVEVSRQTMKSSESKEHRQDNSSGCEAVEVAKDTRVTVKTEIIGRTIEGWHFCDFVYLDFKEFLSCPTRNLSFPGMFEAPLSVVLTETCEIL